MNPIGDLGDRESRQALLPVTEMGEVAVVIEFTRVRKLSRPLVVGVVRREGEVFFRATGLFVAECFAGLSSVVITVASLTRGRAGLLSTFVKGRLLVSGRGEWDDRSCERFSIDSCGRSR